MLHLVLIIIITQILQRSHLITIEFFYYLFNCNRAFFIFVVGIIAIGFFLIKLQSADDYFLYKINLDRHYSFTILSIYALSYL